MIEDWRKTIIDLSDNGCLDNVANTGQPILVTKKEGKSEK